MIHLKKTRKLSKESKYRLASVLSILVILFTLLLSRLFYIMINKSKEYKALAQSQWTNQVKIYPKRGSILDRNDFEFAISADVYRIDLDLVTLKETLKDKNMSVDELISKLSSILDTKSEDISNILNRKLDNGLSATSGILKRKIEKPIADKINDLNLRGIIVSSDTNRYYPNNIIKSIWGGFSWSRRPVILTINGKKYAASMSAMPHAGLDSATAYAVVDNRSEGYGKGQNLDVIKGNGMDGHFDIHFLNSTRHKDGQEDPQHQAAVLKAAGK